jgi:tellurite methyltransferase
MDKGIGQYDFEYSNCPCFWGTEPGKYVRYIPGLVKEGSVLDLGAGEGKNSIYLATLGYKVTGVEISKYAIGNFKIRMEETPETVSRNVEMIHQDVLLFETKSRYDIIIAYGLLHCLPSIESVKQLTEKIIKWVKPNGIVVIVAFNNDLRVPSVQDYLEPTLLPKETFKNLFPGFTVLKYENDIITETHPTSNIEHKHSLTRMIVKKE